LNRLRLGLAICGFVLALLGVALDDVRLAWAAIAVLLGSLLLRLILRNRGKGNLGPEG
jgi:Flp pilus assembly protein TadB